MDNSGKWITQIGKLINFVLDLVFPKFCVKCNREGDWLCNACKKELKLEVKHQELESDLDEIYSLLDYNYQVVQKLIRVFKYNFVVEAAKFFDPLVYEFSLKYYFKNYVIIPVPLFKQRYLSRGFNQSEIIAELFVKHLNLKMDKTCLTRIKFKQAQAKLSKSDRLKNIQDSYVVKNIKYSKVILIDDVYTTGATLNQCAKVLKSRGVKQVVGIVLARKKHST